MAVQNGNGLVIKFATTSSDTKQVFAHAKDASISFSNSLIDTTTKDSSSWAENISGRKSFTLSTSGLLDYAAVADSENITAIEDIALAGTKVFFTFGDTTNTMNGEAFIDSLEENSTSDDVVSYSVTMTGTGELTNT